MKYVRYSSIGLITIVIIAGIAIPLSPSPQGLFEFPIIPGMLASVDIHTGTRTLLEFLVRPILKLRHEALRER